MSAHMPNPGSPQPTASSPHARNSYGDVVAAALAILDEYGLADLSMRRVAASLEVRPSALYWHVPNKQRLLAAVADQILDGTDRVPLTGDLRHDVGTRAAALHEAMLAHRDGAEVVASTVALGVGGRRLADSIREAAAQTDDGAADPVLVESVCSLLLGATTVIQQRRQAAALGVELGEEPAVTGGGVEFGQMLEMLLSRS
ncbi:MAG: TetR family transcriptional regulator [Nesterenkonia sp.]|uniref:TetR family transcriptional regulator n=1 Tax=Nesterenkonia marinintestina TaxID=2979865 RepID=UPI0021BDF383|nr:TetR family transcriptional regulator [Nesterenkonia sp. GX14115]MDO5492632.1 TetR family transcriptional regulator [Nesterenkonia sp.]